MSASKPEPMPPRHFEVTAHLAQGEMLVFATGNEKEAIGFAINYAYRHATHAVSVHEESYDPGDRLFKSRRVWFRAPSHEPSRARRKIVTLRR
jgi:hypothetical protein